MLSSIVIKLTQAMYINFRKPYSSPFQIPEPATGLKRCVGWARVQDNAERDFFLFRKLAFVRYIAANKLDAPLPSKLWPIGLFRSTPASREELGYYRIYHSLFCLGPCSYRKAFSGSWRSAPAHPCFVCCLPLPGSSSAPPPFKLAKEPRAAQLA